MTLKHGLTALIIAGGFAAGSALAQVDYREYPGQDFEAVDKDPPLSSNDPAANMAGMGVEDTADASMTAESELQERIRQLEERNAQLEDELEQQSMLSEQELEDERAALEMEREELERQRQELEASGQTAAAGGQRIEWGEADQRDDANVAQVPPPVTPELIRELQQTLRAQGQDPGPIDGIWGPQTHQALQAFQQESNLGASGQLTGDTLAELELESSSTQRAEAPAQEQPEEQQQALAE